VIVLAFDPGTATTGYGVVKEAQGGQLIAVAYGVILTPAGVAPPLRLQKIYEETLTLIDTYRPDSVATERLFFNKNETTALSVGRSIGVILLAIAQKKMPWAE
jgi:crossover junction endodeoxyribonuclease RuvC